MKSLQHILSKNSNFHSLNDILKENFKFKINRNNSVYSETPKTYKELKAIVNVRYKKDKEQLDLQDIDVSNVENNRTDVGLFEGFYHVKYINVSGWDISKMHYLAHWFDACGELEEITGLETWDTSNVVDMTKMFRDCFKLENLSEINSWDISNVRFMNKTFENCKSITNVDLTDWKPIKLEDMTSIFSGCEKLDSVGDLANWDITNVKDYMKNAFLNCNITAYPDWYDFDAETYNTKYSK